MFYYYYYIYKVEKIYLIFHLCFKMAKLKNPIKIMRLVYNLQNILK